MFKIFKRDDSKKQEPLGKDKLKNYFDFFSKLVLKEYSSFKWNIMSSAYSTKVIGHMIMSTFYDQTPIGSEIKIDTVYDSLKGTVVCSVLSDGTAIAAKDFPLKLTKEILSEKMLNFAKREVYGLLEDYY